jgi:hypothetical protein
VPVHSVKAQEYHRLADWGVADNMVYRNGSLINLTSGLTAIGDHRVTLSSGAGLQFKCNVCTIAHKYGITGREAD